jgi:hypothetical protein
MSDWRDSQKRWVRTTALLAVFLIPIAFVAGVLWAVFS